MDKKLQPLSDDQLSLVSGGGTAEAQEYLEELMEKYHCQRWDLYENMTQEEYNHYVYLYEH